MRAIANEANGEQFDSPRLRVTEQPDGCIAPDGLAIRPWQSTAGNQPVEAHSSSSSLPIGARVICLRPSLISNSSPGCRPRMAV